LLDSLLQERYMKDGEWNRIKQLDLGFLGF